MDTGYIKSLLKKYYDGSSSLEEESILKSFFTSDTKIPAELETDRKVFKLLTSDTENNLDTALPVGMEARMSHLIDNLSTKHRHILRLRIFFGGAVAAMMIISAGIMTYHQTTATSQPATAITDEQAIAYTEKSLNLLLNTVRRGTAESAKAQETLLSTTSTAVTQIKKI